MTWGLKIVLAGMAFKDWILPNFNLDLATAIISSVMYRHTYFNTIMHACLDQFVARSTSFVLPWLLLRVYLGCQLD